MDNSERKIYNLLDISNSLKSVIAKTYARYYWIKAEIIKLNYYSKSGHCYPDLAEKSGGIIKAQMRSTIWADNYIQISRNFKEITKEKLDEGMTILFRAKLSFHPLHGLSLNIVEIEPSFTLGVMAMEKQNTIDKLKKEGIFDLNKKLAFPLIPKRIAVISVDTSKGYNDFINIIDKNQWNYKFSHVLYPALLQGDKAVNSIRKQFDFIKQNINDFDIAVLIRGGGGDIGLNCYDNVELAREVALFPIPIITGIGHSTNTTVVEMIANKNKITPTDLAYELIQSFHNFYARIEFAQNKIVELCQNLISFESNRYANSIKDIKSISINLVERNKLSLSNTIKNLNKSSKLFISNTERNILEITSSLNYRPNQIINRENELFTAYEKLLNICTKQFIDKENRRIEHNTSKIKLLKPENILKRGYSITRLNGEVIKNRLDIKKGDIIETELFDSVLQSKIESINKKDE